MDLHRCTPKQAGKPRRAVWSRLECGVFIVLLALPTLGSLIQIDHLVPLAENRQLSAAPEMPGSLDEWQAFPDRFDRYFNDHFGFRNWLVRLHHQFEWTYQRTSGWITVGKDGWLYMGEEETLSERHCVMPEGSDLAGWVDLLRSRQAALDALGIAYLFALAPNKHTVYPEFLPDRARVDADHCPLALFGSTMTSGAGIDFLDLRPRVRRSRSEGLFAVDPPLRLFHRTDTHWNHTGALIGAQAILEALAERYPEVEVPRLDDFELGVLSDAPGGNLGRFLENYGLSYLEDWIYLEPLHPTRARAAEGSPVLDPFDNDRTDLRLILETGDQRLPRAVVFHDSSAYALMAPLAEAFERVVFVRQVSGEIDLELIEEEQPDWVLSLIVETALLDPPQAPGHL